MEENLSQNTWEEYGFKKNPYSVKPLSLCHESLPLDSAFVGRREESSETRLLTSIFRVPGGNCTVVEGEVGVGKTTFLNYHRYLWEYKARDKLLSPDCEIGITTEWTLKDFITNILAALTSKLYSIPKIQRKIYRKKFFKELKVLTSVYLDSSLSLNGGIWGVQVGLKSNEVITLPELSEFQLLNYFRQLVKEIKALGYSGIILHFDNLELISQTQPKRMTEIFQNIRDTLMTSDVYFLFVGHPGFYSEIIAPLERVRSIFLGYPVYVNPLSEKEVLELFERRYQILSMGPEFIRPVEDKFIVYLYNLFEGKVRFIMDSLNTLITSFSADEKRTLSVDDAREELVKVVMERLRPLSQKEREVLKEMVSLKDFTNQQISKKTGVAPSNMTNIIKALRKNNMIYLYRLEGKKIFYRVNEEIKILSDKKIRKGLKTLVDAGSVDLRDFRGRIFTRRDFEEATGMAPSTARKKLKELVDGKVLLQQGKGRATRYMVVI